MKKWWQSCVLAYSRYCALIGFESSVSSDRCAGAVRTSALWTIDLWLRACVSQRWKDFYHCSCYFFWQNACMWWIWEQIGQVKLVWTTWSWLRSRIWEGSSTPKGSLGCHTPGTCITNVPTPDSDLWGFDSWFGMSVKDSSTLVG